MSEINKGVLIYNEWFDAMKNLNAKDFKSLILAMYDYQIYDVPPPEFKGKSSIVSSMIFSCLKRRKQQAARGKLGAESRANRASAIKKDEVSPPTSPVFDIHFFSPSAAMSTAASTDKENAPSGDENDEASGDLSTATSQSIEEHSVAEYSITEHNLAERSVAYPTLCGGDMPPDRSEIGTQIPSAPSQTGAKAPTSNALSLAETQKGYGIYQNVFLSNSEYLLIKNTVDNAEKYIDNFSAKLYSKGYRYPNHAQAILDWWKKDSRLPKDKSTDTSPNSPPSYGSFDTDRFFEAALKRSLGEDAEG